MPTSTQPPSGSRAAPPKLIFQHIPPTRFASRNIPLDVIERFKQHGGVTSVNSALKAQASNSAHASSSLSASKPSHEPFSLYLVLPTDHEGILRLLSSRPLVLYDIKWVDDSIQEGEALDLGAYVIDGLSVFTSRRTIDPIDRRHRSPDSASSSSISGGEDEAWEHAEVVEDDTEFAPVDKEINRKNEHSNLGSPTVKRERCASSEEPSEYGEEQVKDREERATIKAPARPARAHPLVQETVPNFPCGSPASSPPPASSSSRPRSHSVLPNWRTRQFIPRPEVHSTYKREPTPLVTIHQERASSVAPSTVMYTQNAPYVRATHMEDPEHSPKRTKIRMKLDGPSKLIGHQDHSATRSGPSQRLTGRSLTEQLEQHCRSRRGSTHANQGSSEADQEDDATVKSDPIITPNVKNEPLDDVKDEIVSLATTWKDDLSEISEEEVEPVELKPFEVMNYRAMQGSSKSSRKL